MLLNTCTRGGVLSFGNDGADDQACDGQRRHQNLQRAEAGIGPETDLCADDQADLDEQKTDRGTRRSVTQRDPEQRQEQQIEQLKRGRVLVAEHHAERADERHELRHDQRLQARPRPIGDGEKHERGNDEDADDVADRGAPGDHDHLVLENGAGAEQDHDIRGGRDERGCRADADQRQSVTHEAKARIERRDVLEREAARGIGGADGERKPEFQPHAERGAAHHGIGQRGGDEHKRRIEPAAQKHDGDAEPGRRVPRRDAETAIGLHIAHVIERDIGHEEEAPEGKTTIKAIIDHFRPYKFGRAASPLRRG